MKKIILSLSVLLVGVIATKSAIAGLVAGSNAANYNVIVGTGGSVFTGAGIVWTVLLSTGNGATYSAIVDTDTTAGYQGDYTSAVWDNKRVTPQMTHIGNSTGNPNVPLTLVPGKGVRVKKGASVIGTGSANFIGVYWSQD